MGGESLYRIQIFKQNWIILNLFKTYWIVTNLGVTQWVGWLGGVDVGGSVFTKQNGIILISFQIIEFLVIWHDPTHWPIQYPTHPPNHPYIQSKVEVSPQTINL